MKSRGQPAPLRIASIGRNFNVQNVDTIRFESDRTFLDFDVVVWDPWTFFDEYTGRPRGARSLGRPIDRADLERLKADVNRRREELAAFYKLGRTFVFFVPTPEWCFVAEQHRDPSARPDPAVGTQFFLPFVGELVQASGRGIDIRAAEPWRSFLEQNRPALSYRASLRDHKLKPLAFIHGTDHCLGGCQQRDNGLLIVLPGIHLSSPPGSADELAKASIFISSLEALLVSLRAESGEQVLPAWANRYLLPSELEARTRVDALEAELEKARKALETQRADLASIERFKVLFTGTDEPQRRTVAEVFRALGFDVHDEDEMKADLIIKYGDRTAVVEVKGVLAGGALKHVRQLESWAQEHGLDYGTDPKGILVLNAYSDQPLDERSTDVFPDPVVKFSTKRDHCLMTGLDLLCLYLDALRNPSRREMLIEALFWTAGVFDYYAKNWRQWVTVSTLPSAAGRGPEAA